MTDVEILMDMYGYTEEKCQYLLDNYNHSTNIKAYRAGYEKGYDKAIDDAAWNYGYFDDDILD